MKRTSLLFGFLALVILALLFYFYSGHQTPSGQRPLADLNSASMSGLKNEFNSGSSHVRMLVLLSPT
jgi:hypothetical protein